MVNFKQSVFIVVFFIFSVKLISADDGTISYDKQPTRLRVTNQCSFPIWIQLSKNLAEANKQNIKLNTGQSHDYAIPKPKKGTQLEGTRLWPKTGCDDSRNNCDIGQSMEPCPSGGCQPPIESKFEATWAAMSCPYGKSDSTGQKPDASCMTWYNASQVDGYTLPFRIIAKGPDVGKFGCVSSDASELDLNQCPTNEDLSGGKQEYSKYKNVDLRVFDKKGTVIGCIAPCKKLNFPAPWGFGMSEEKDPALHMCCPTDPERIKNDTCTWPNACATSKACSNSKDPLSVVHTKYVKAIKEMAPTVYSYSYDDAEGLHTCTARTKFEIIFGPISISKIKQKSSKELKGLNTLSNSLIQLKDKLGSK